MSAAVASAPPMAGGAGGPPAPPPPPRPPARPGGAPAQPVPPSNTATTAVAAPAPAAAATAAPQRTYGTTTIVRTTSGPPAPGVPVAQTVTIPGGGRPTLRRSAKDPRSGLSAYLVANEKGEQCHISVALRCADRFVGTILRGHRTAVVDMEFIADLPTASINGPTHGADPTGKFHGRGPVDNNNEVFTLGSCDRDGVVFLWFMQVVKNELNIETGLRILRKYSFYSLRLSEDSHYARIRLAGTHRRGHMVLVPNDGSSVRVIGFRCDVDPVSGAAVPVIEAPPSRPALPAPPLPSAAAGATSRDIDAEGRHRRLPHAAGAAAGVASATGLAAGAAAVHHENHATERDAEHGRMDHSDEEEYEDEDGDEEYEDDEEVADYDENDYDRDGEGYHGDGRNDGYVDNDYDDHQGSGNAQGLATHEHGLSSDPDDYGADERVEDHEDFGEFKDALGPRPHP